MALHRARTPGSGHPPPFPGLRVEAISNNKLAAFDTGVDDILTVPFAPEQLLARVTPVLRRPYSDTVTFTPVIKIGRLEIDSVNRSVRAGTLELP